MREKGAGSGRRWGSKPVKRRASRATSATSRTDRPVALLKVLCMKGILLAERPAAYGLLSKPALGGLYGWSVLVSRPGGAKLSA